MKFLYLANIVQADTFKQQAHTHTHMIPICRAAEVYKACKGCCSQIRGDRLHQRAAIQLRDKIQSLEQGIHLLPSRLQRNAKQGYCRLKYRKADVCQMAQRLSPCHP